jgi:hypothetical protein
MPFDFSLFDKTGDVFGTTENLFKPSVRRKRVKVGYRRTYTCRPVQAQCDSTCNAAFASTVGSNDHVEVRAGAELDIVVCYEVA